MICKMDGNEGYELEEKHVVLKVSEGGSNDGSIFEKNLGSTQLARMSD